MKKNEEIEKILEQIRNILIVIAVILLINVIVTSIGNSSKNNTTSTNPSSDSSSDSSSNNEQLPEYDVTSFTEVTVDEMFSKVATSGYQVVYIGRSVVDIAVYS